MRKFLITIVIFSITTFAMAASTVLTCPPGMFIDKGLCTFEIKDMRKAVSIPNKVLSANYFIQGGKLFSSVLAAPANECTAPYAKALGMCAWNITNMNSRPTMTIPDKVIASKVFTKGNKLYFRYTLAEAKCPGQQWVKAGRCVGALTSMSQAGRDLKDQFLSSDHFIKNRKLYGHILFNNPPCPAPKVQLIFPSGNWVCGENIKLSQVTAQYLAHKNEVPLEPSHFTTGKKLYRKYGTPQLSCPNGQIIDGGYCSKVITNIGQVANQLVNIAIGNGYIINSKQLLHVKPITPCPSDQQLLQGYCIGEIIYTSQVGSDFPAVKIEIGKNFYFSNKKLYKRGNKAAVGRGRTNRR